MKARISLEDAAFSYGDKGVFSGLNLEVSQGDILCLLGANGCGKTTLLRCLHGALALKKGKVWLDGEDILSLSTTEIAKKVGFVFQQHSAPFPYSVLEVVRMGRAPHLGMFASPSPMDTRIAEQALETVGVLYLRDKRYTEISGGERQLTLIARTLAQQPELILLDEPTASLDFKNQALVLRMIKKLAEQGLTIIMSSHFPNHALLFSSRVVMMNSGTFMDVGEPDEVITEENLRATYGMDVRIFSVIDPTSGDDIRFCIPASKATDILTSGLGGIENSFQGESELRGEIALIDIGGNTRLEAVTRKEGKVRVYLPSNEIILSTTKIRSSGRNVLKGRITKLQEQDMTVKVEVDTGQKITVLITRKSSTNLGLRIGMDVYVTIKASAVQVF